MTEANDDILDLDSIKDETNENNDLTLNKQVSETAQKKKRPYKKSNKNKGAADLLNSLEKPKLSREERKNMQLLQLFDKLEQKEKRKEDVTLRKKRKMNSERSPEHSVTHTDSHPADDLDKHEENGDHTPHKSRSNSPEPEKPLITKKVKSEPTKITSKYFNISYDLGSSANLLAYLFEYQKQNASKFSHTKNTKSIDFTPKANGVHPTEETSLVKCENQKLSTLKEQIKQQNVKFLEHLKNFDAIKATRDMRHIFFDLNSK